MNKECIILAGGLGTRLQSVVSDVPKCMAEIANKPFFSHLFDYLEKEKINHIILSLGYKSEVVIDWLQTQKRSFDISYIIEDEPLGTGGAIRLAFSKVKTDRAFVINGDTLFDVELSKLSNFHIKNKADISLALKPMQDFDRYGSVEMNSENRIERFIEKKHLESGIINGGVYLVNKDIFSKTSLLEKFSFEKEILESKLNSLAIYGYAFDNYFIDIGIPSDYEKANIDFAKRIKGE